jgi:hypothetical protein
MNPILHTEQAMRDAFIAQAYDWPASIKAGTAPIFDEDDSDAAARGTPLPCIICEASSAQQIHPELQTYEVECEVQVRHSADDTTAEVHTTQAAQAANLISGHDWATLVSAGDTISADHRSAVNQRKERVGRLWIYSISFSLFISLKP